MEGPEGRCYLEESGRRAVAAASLQLSLVSSRQSRMARTSSPQTPLVLWICAAVCVHFFMGGGTEEVSKQLRKYSDDRQYLSMLGSKTRERVRQTEQSFDIAVVDEGKPKEE